MSRTIEMQTCESPLLFLSDETIRRESAPVKKIKRRSLGLNKFAEDHLNLESNKYSIMPLAKTNIFKHNTRSVR